MTSPPKEEEAKARLTSTVSYLAEGPRFNDIRAILAENERLQSALAEALGALEPFANAAAHLHPSQPDDGVTLDGFEVGDFRRAAEIHSRLSNGEGGEA